MLRLKKLAASAHVSSVRSWEFQGDFSFQDIADRCRAVVNIGLVEKTYLKVIGMFTRTLGPTVEAVLTHSPRWTPKVMGYDSVWGMEGGRKKTRKNAEIIAINSDNIRACL
jgi:hypothetical protein